MSFEENRSISRGSLPLILTVKVIGITYPIFIDATPFKEAISFTFRLSQVFFPLRESFLHVILGSPMEW